MFKRCLNVGLLWVYFTLVHSTLSIIILLPIFQQLSIYIIISSTFTFYVLQYNWCSIILFSFPSFSKFHSVVPLYYNHVPHLSLYMIMLAVAYMLSFGSIFHVGLCVSEPDFISLNIMASNCIHFPSNHMSLFLMAE
jgi:hypothetical protein